MAFQKIHPLLVFVKRILNHTLYMSSIDSKIVVIGPPGILY